MMTEQLAFNVIAAPLAAIDRRALSQAWYSSLHIAHQRASHPARKPVAGQRFEGPRALEMPARAAAVPRVPGKTAAAARRSEDLRAIVRESGVERRIPRSSLARRIEQTFLMPHVEEKRATFCVGSRKARVYVAMQRVGGRLHLVAIAPHAVRAEVARALDEARYGLAERGIAISVALAESRHER